MVAALVLGGCSGQARHAPVPEPAPTVVATAEPVVLFQLLIVRDWDSLYFVCEKEDHDWTLAQAVAFGIPEALWIRFAQEGPADARFQIFWVRPIHV